MPAIFVMAGGDKSEELQYTMKQDVRIWSVQDIGGRLIVPEKYERGYSGPMEIDPGDMVIRLNSYEVNFWGIEELNYFTILSTTKSKVGYVMELMNPRGQTAKMKAVLDEDNYLSLLYFNSKNFGEHTFFLASKNSKQLRAEAAAFTGADFKKIKKAEDLFNEDIRPYAFFNAGEDPAQPNFLSAKDSVSFSFSNDTLITNQHIRQVKKVKTAKSGSIDKPGIQQIYQFVFKKGGDPLLVYVDRYGRLALLEYERQYYMLRP